MKAAWTAISTAWMLVGALMIAATLFYGSLFFAINPTPWDFPGDPPLFELLAYAGVVGTFLNVPLWLLSNDSNNHRDSFMQFRASVQSQVWLSS